MHHRCRLIAGVAAAVALATAAVAVAAVTPPPSIAKASKIVFCSDISYPPEESYKGSTAVGSDIDFGTAVAQLMGVKAEFKNISFGTIIAALRAKKCDAIISGMSDTAPRRKVVDFVDYLKLGRSLMVKRGNPAHIASLTDLSGKSVAAQAGTTHAVFLVAESKTLQKAGKKPITIETFPQDSQATAALKSGKADAYFGDSPTVAYYVSRDPTFAIVGTPITPSPIGIAIRKHDPLRAAVQQAITTLYANGTIAKIVAKWGMSNAATLLR